MSIVEELRERATHVAQFFDHRQSAALMLKAADLLEKHLPVETPIEQVVTKGEE